MDKRVSVEILDEIERRCVAATPGPWKSFIEARDHMVGSDFIQTAGEDIYLTGATLADQEFIAHARQDLPMLIDEVRTLWAARGAREKS